MFVPIMSWGQKWHPFGGIAQRKFQRKLGVEFGPGKVKFMDFFFLKFIGG